jgi:hypothetical protein
MGRIKIKDMEGKEKDLQKLFQKSGCSLADFLKIEKRKKVSAIWLWMLVFAFFVLACCDCLECLFSQRINHEVRQCSGEKIWSITLNRFEMSA